MLAEGGRYEGAVRNGGHLSYTATPRKRRICFPLRFRTANAKGVPHPASHMWEPQICSSPGSTAPKSSTLTDTA